ncbi:TetR/AcrR family transcriptional regulator [Pseudactinotalea sp. HY158]|uniref:TetR/AcrR family transcriptional regulator n=1 Tax=Pseudactinotalea sp. HY158 TaxID=2654547 RepID=UPI00129C2CB3|nr:helix-turn-helix domain-containing protein [Pseudactinotalea sp. HY158]QGH70724.1 TetR family transcriptional regulator [Pseudactinotalea sp. HY158]
MSSDRMPPERRARLVRVAATEFAAGYEAASLNRIIRECGLSKSSFYHAISSKRELFDLVVDDLAAAVSAAVPLPTPESLGSADSPAGAPGGDFWGGARALMGTLVEAATRVPTFAALGALFYVSDAPTGSRLTELDRAIDAWVGRALELGRASGAVRTDLPTDLQYRLALAALRALDRWSLEHLEEVVGAGALAEAQLDAVRRLLEP